MKKKIFDRDYLLTDKISKKNNKNIPIIENKKKDISNTEAFLNLNKKKAKTTPKYRANNLEIIKKKDIEDFYNKISSRELVSLSSMSQLMLLSLNSKNPLSKQESYQNISDPNYSHLTLLNVRKRKERNDNDIEFSDSQLKEEKVLEEYQNGVEKEDKSNKFHFFKKCLIKKIIKKITRILSKIKNYIEKKESPLQQEKLFELYELKKLQNEFVEEDSNKQFFETDEYNK